MEKKSGVLVVNGLPMVQAQFNWSVGFQMQTFLQTLAKKKFLASKCPECGYVYAPPRNTCAKCYKPMTDKDNIELSGKGKLQGWTTAYVELDGKGNFVDLKKPKLIAAVKMEGANSTLFLPLEAEAKKLKPGMDVAIEWNSETKGGWKDIKFLRPA